MNETIEYVMTDDEKLRAKLHSLLLSFRYESSIGLGERKLGNHHIEALVDYLVPWIASEVLFNKEN